MSGGGPEHPVVIAPHQSRFLDLPESFVFADPEEGTGGPTFAQGFVASGISGGLKDSGRPDTGVLAVAPEWRGAATSAAMFTTNAFPAAPVVVDRADCDLTSLKAIVVNSGNANACTGEQGMATARATQKSVAEVLSLEPAGVAVASTGIIGVQLDEGRITTAARRASSEMGPYGGSAFAKSIVTTDRFEKTCAGSVATPAGMVRIGACAKGAGMICPAMATMLCFVTTDAVLTGEQADDLLKQAVDKSFNLVTVDGEMSTNDSVFLLASGASGVTPDTASLELIARALEFVLLRLALMMVADGEGATKIVRLRVDGAGSKAVAARVGRAVADSPLVKTAMHGADPNWGRVISSAGAAMAGESLPNASLQLCGVTVVEKGAACVVGEREQAQMAAEMKTAEIDIELDLGNGDAGAEIFFADMGHEYITINAEYHS